MEGLQSVRLCACSFIACFVIEISVTLVLMLQVVSTSLESDVVRFTSSDSVLRLFAYKGSYNINLSLEIRT